MRFLSNKEVKLFNKKWNVKCKKIKEIPLKSCVVYESNNNLLIVKKENIEFPFLKHIDEPYVIVDNGAIPFILKGANIMRPGIIELSEFSKGQIVCIKNMKKLTIVVGISLFSSKDITNMKKGKVIKILHHINDEV